MTKVATPQKDVPVKEIENPLTPEYEVAAGRSELAEMHRAGSKVEPEEAPVTEEELRQVYSKAAAGTILEAAFVDPAYTWPPAEGQGKNAIELQASVKLLEDDDASSFQTTETQQKRMADPGMPKKPWWKCCQSNDAVVEDMRAYQEQKLAAEKERKLHAKIKKERLRQKEKDYRKKHRYHRVPEGILIYRLDTTDHTLELMSQPHAKTDMGAIVQKTKVVKAVPAFDKSRRGMEVTGDDGRTFTLVACEQRTATAWLEAMSLMHAKSDSNKGFFSKVRT
jgi:hypothetical protein